MDDQAATKKLAAALDKHRVGAFSGTEVGCDCDRRWRARGEYRQHLAAALLPVVREIAADELRAAGEDRTTVSKLTLVESLTCFIVKLEDLFHRAEELTGRTT